MEGTPSPSQQLGKYQLVATLGQGGMGTVYLALASGLGQFRKLLVVKELRQDLTRQKGFVNMFMDEAKLAARLAHPNVVQTFEASEVGDRYFLAMEYLDGQPLSALLDRLAQAQSPKLSLWIHLQILCDVLSGLHYAHELLDYDGSSLQVVHRDVSPQNVFVTYHGQVKVMDFGVAKVANASVRTAPGVFVGKFTYAAPEQVLGNPVDARTDVFAVGVMLWQAISGRPFSNQAPTGAACRARTEGLEPRIADVVPDVDPLLAEISNRALAVDPEQRFASATEFRSQLQEYMQQAGVRVEAAEIGQLMHEVFDTERRSLHVLIEQAMSRTGVSQASVDELSILNFADKEPTAVADLSSLVEVSHERDDQKIRLGYAHSKVTLVRSPNEQESVSPMPTITQTHRRRLVAIAALSVGTLVGVSVALFGYGSPPPVSPPPSSEVTANSPITVDPPKPDLPTSPSAVEKSELAAVVPEHKLPEAESAVVAAPPLRREAPAPQRSSSASTQSKTRNNNNNNSSRPAMPARPAPVARELPEPSILHLSVPEPASVQRTPDEGADLVFGRRSTAVHIDRENPYR